MKNPKSSRLGIGFYFAHQNGGYDRGNHGSGEDFSPTETVGEQSKGNPSQAAQQDGDGHGDAGLYGRKMQLLLQHRHHGGDRAKNSKAKSESSCTQNQLQRTGTMRVGFHGPTGFLNRYFRSERNFLYVTKITGVKKPMISGGRTGRIVLASCEPKFEFQNG